MLLCFLEVVSFYGLILQYNIEQCVRNKILMQTPIPYFCRGFGSEDDLAVYSSSTRVQRNDALLRRYSLV